MTANGYDVWQQERDAASSAYERGKMEGRRAAQTEASRIIALLTMRLGGRVTLSPSELTDDWPTLTTWDEPDGSKFLVAVLGRSSTSEIESAADLGGAPE